MLKSAELFTQYGGQMQVHAGPTTVAGQAPMLRAAALRTNNPTFVATQATYFVETDETNHRYTAVLGWNHAILLKVDGNNVYRPYRLLAHGSPPSYAAFNDIADLNNGKLKPLASVNPNANAVRLCGQDWTLMKPPDIVLERIITYGVSSCSFAVLAHRPAWDWVAVSHMSGGPPIPVAVMMEKARVRGMFKFFASSFPQRNELSKFTSSTSLSRGEISGTICTRGTLPPPNTGTLQYPQFAHTEIGMVLTSRLPSITGIFGLENNTDYPRLVPVEWSTRLKALAASRIAGTDKVFDAPWNLGPGVWTGLGQPVKDLFSHFGITLPGNATSQRVNGSMVWHVTVPRQGVSDTVYICTANTQSVQQVRNCFNYTHSGGTPSGQLIEENNQLADRLDINAPKHLWSAALKDMGLRDEDVTGGVTTVSRGRQWRINLDGATMTVTYGGKQRIEQRRTRLQVTNATEARDAALDILAPLMQGHSGFGALHTAVANQMKDKLRRDGASSVWFGNEFQNLQRAQYQAVDPHWDQQAYWKPAVAIMLGHYLAHDADHAYRSIPEGLVPRHRHEFTIPLSQVR